MARAQGWGPGGQCVACAFWPPARACHSRRQGIACVVWHWPPPVIRVVIRHCLPITRATLHPLEHMGGPPGQHNGPPIVSAVTFPRALRVWNSIQSHACFAIGCLIYLTFRLASNALVTSLGFI